MFHSSMTSSDGILVFRSGRHLETALAVLRRHYPHASILVVSQAGTESLLDRLGIDAEQRFIYSAGRFFSPLHLFLSATGLKLLWRRLRGVFRRVAVLWPDPVGASHTNVNVTALCFATGSVLAITPEGRLIASGAAVTLLNLFLRPLQAALAKSWKELRADAAKFAHAWRRFWVSSEGPELEPRPWHSHFLALHCINRALPLLSHQIKGLVVDVGAGTGYGARYLLRDRTLYIPTDLPGGRDALDLTISRIGVRPRVYCSGYALPFKSGSVDGVLALSILEHLRDPASVLREAHRILKSGGKLLVLTPFCFPLHGEPDDFRRWTAPGLDLQLAHAGFSSCQTRRIGNTLSSLVLNFNLYLKYQLAPSGPLIIRFCLCLFAPCCTLLQGLSNVAAILVGRIERSTRFPLCIASLATKPECPGTG